MKGCYLMNRSFAPIGHTIAKNLKEDYGVEACAVVVTRQAYGYLKSQKDFEYTGFLLEEDIHKLYKEEKVDFGYIKKLEEEYGLPNLWPYLYADRIFMHGQFLREYPYDKPMLTHYEMLQRLQVTAKSIIEFLDKEKPDFLFIKVVGSLPTNLLYYISKKKGIRTLFADETRVGNGETLTSDYGKFSYAEERWNGRGDGSKSKMRSDAVKFVQDFKNKPRAYYNDSKMTQPDGSLTGVFAQLGFMKPVRLLKNFSLYLKSIYNYYSAKEHDFTDINPLLNIWDKIKRKCRGMRGYEDLYSAPDLKSNFAYFPLHYNPEISTMFLAPLYADQVMVIKQAARSLPVDFKLYVKEHPAMVGYRTRGFYKEILKVPNVVLVRPKYSSYELLNKSKMVYTLSGTVGWEAAIVGRPVITFGDVFYNVLSGVKRCHSFEHLAQLTREHLANYRYDEDEVVDFVSAVKEESVLIDIYYLWGEENDLSKITNNESLKKFSVYMAGKLGLEK